jgi:hypothetical protein
MSVWPTPHHNHEARAHIPAHPLSLQDLAIFAGGLLIAVMIGVAASGVLPLG